MQRANWVATGFFAFASSLFLTVSAQAEDIDIFGINSTSATKPNVLLVLDTSESMRADLNGDNPYVTGLDSRLTLLKNAVYNFLDINKDKLRVGFLSFDDSSSGIKWPISDLNELASNYDSNISATSGLQVIDVLKKELDNLTGRYTTNTVSALVEAALYYQGEAVTVGGRNRNMPRYWAPPVWNMVNQEYDFSHRACPNAAAYDPKNAYRTNTFGTSHDICDDFTLGGTVAGINHCAGKTNVRTCYQRSGREVRNSPVYTYIEPHIRCTYDHPDEWTGANYISPIQNGCQTNVVLLISDGKPTTTWDYQEKTDFLGYPSDQCDDLAAEGLDIDVAADGNCGSDVIRQLYQQDMIPTMPGSNVTTYSIGFTIDPDGEQYLQRITQEGNGKYFSAIDWASLNGALLNISEMLLPPSRSFSSPSLTINPSTFSHDDTVYLSLFDPSPNHSWQGNLKGYFMDGSGLLDLNGNAATEATASGTQFVETAQSFWSPVPDGKETTKGGASGRIDPATRKLYTYTGSAIPTGGAALVTQANIHDIKVSNSHLTADLLGISTRPQLRDTLIDWLRNAPMGDPLHSNNVVVNYASEKVVFAMTNQGLLHSILATTPKSVGQLDTTGGSELWGFMPPDLLPNIQSLSGNKTTTGHVYGLDGFITPWHEDNNQDGIVNGSDRMLLIFGKRRGGNDYYALDVTNVRQPVFKWKITGGTAPFANLAQTWSRMSVITIPSGTGTKQVALFGGGYDPVNDNLSSRTPASGNSIYIIDRDGKLLWNATHHNMKYSIPASVVALDTDQDSLADRLYTADAGGNIWRVDFPQGLASNVTVSQVADLGADSYQPFFNPPSVSIEHGFGQVYFSLAIGSGDRTDPVNSGSNNRLFMLRDKNVETGPPDANQSLINTADLFDATSDSFSGSNQQVKLSYQKLAASDGWYINLAQGEKILSQVVTLESRILATSLYNVNNQANSCDVPETLGRYYSVSVKTGSGVKDKSLKSAKQTSSSSTPEARYVEFKNEGIPTAPSVVALPDTASLNVVVDNTVMDTVAPTLNQVFWFQIE